MTPLEHARRLLARGITPIPVPHMQKGPRLPGWQRLRLSADELPRHFGNGPCNIGVLLGDPSGGLVDVDLDCDEAVELAERYLPPTGAVTGRPSRPGSHRWYVATGAVTVQHKDPKTGAMIVELRSTGAQTVVGPSVHPEGEVYDPLEGEPAVVSAAMLAASVKALADAVIERRHGRAEPPPPARPERRAQPLPAGQIKHRAAAYLDAMPPAISGQGGHGQTYAAAVTLVHGFALDTETALRMLMDRYNPRCEPPWTEKELRHKIDDAASKPHDQPRGWLRDASGSPSAPPAEIRSTEAKTEPGEPSRPAPAKPFVPFPVERLPYPLSDYVQQGSQASGCDPAFLALPLVSGLAAVIGNTRRIMLRSGWTEPAIIWTAIIGESGTQKSPAFRLAFKTIKAIQAEHYQRYREAQERYRQASLMHETALRQWKLKAAGKSGTDAGEPPTEPVKPACVRLWIEDATTEALAELLHQNPRGLLMIRAELSGWFCFGRYKQGGGSDEVARWLQMFDGDECTVDRRGSGTLFIPRPAVSIAGAIQPEILERALGDQHRQNGLLARMLIAHPPRRAKRWSDEEIDPELDAEVAEIFSRLYARKLEFDNHGVSRPELLPLTPDARERWIAFVNEHGQRQLAHVGDEAAAFSKIEAYAARLALITHCVRVAGDDATVAHPDRVDLDSIEAGIALALWFLDEAMRVYGTHGENEAAREIRKLVELVERQGGSVRVREWQRLRSLKAAGDAEAELGALVEAGLGKFRNLASGSKGGRPSRMFVLHGFGASDRTPSPDIAAAPETS